MYALKRLVCSDTNGTDDVGVTGVVGEKDGTGNSCTLSFCIGGERCWRCERPKHNNRETAFLKRLSEAKRSCDRRERGSRVSQWKSSL